MTIIRWAMEYSLRKLAKSKKKMPFFFHRSKQKRSGCGSSSRRLSWNTAASWRWRSAVRILTRCIPWGALLTALLTAVTGRWWVEGNGAHCNKGRTIYCWVLRVVLGRDLFFDMIILWNLRTGGYNKRMLLFEGLWRNGEIVKNELNQNCDFFPHLGILDWLSMVVMKWHAVWR